MMPKMHAIQKRTKGIAGNGFIRLGYFVKVIKYIQSQKNTEYQGLSICILVLS